MGRVVCFGELLLRLTAPGRELLLQSGRLDCPCRRRRGQCRGRLGAARARNRNGEPGPRQCARRRRGWAFAALRRRRVGGWRPGRGGWASISCRRGAGVRPSDIVYDREGSAFALAGPDDFDWDRCSTAPTCCTSPASRRRLGKAPPMRRWPRPRRRGRGRFRSRSTAITARSSGGAGTAIRRAILPALVAKADILFGNHRDISLLLGRDFGGEGEARRREAAQAAFDAFPQLQMIASTARHVADADTHRIAARIDARRRLGPDRGNRGRRDRRPDRRGRRLRGGDPARRADRARPRRDGPCRAGADLPQAQPRRATRACSGKATSRRSSPESSTSAARISRRALLAGFALAPGNRPRAVRGHRGRHPRLSRHSLRHGRSASGAPVAAAPSRGGGAFGPS